MRVTPTVWFTALAALLVTACQTTPRCPPPAERVLSVGCQDCGLPLRLDRGDWAVSERSEVWKVEEPKEGRPPEAIGYMVKRRYRQMRGGPAYDVYTVTTLDRRDVIGRIDQLGKAWRYEPRRNQGFEEVDLGVGTLENDVTKIFQAEKPLLLEKTTERHLAFETLDKNGDGLLQKDEVSGLGDRIAGADTNHDGVIDFGEFDALDVL